MKNQKTHILLIEDDLAFTGLVMRSFRFQQDQLILNCVKSLSEAIQNIQEQAPNIIISDMRLPDGDGIELIKQVRDKFPVIIITGYGNEAEAVEVVREGALDYVIKSIEMIENMPHIVERALISWQHIQQRQKAQDALTQQSIEIAHALRLSTMGQMISSLSHEINQPLTAISTLSNGLVNIIGQKPDNFSETFKDSLNEISRQSIRLGEIVRRIRGFSKKQAPHTGPVLINELLEECLLFIKQELKKTAVVVKKQYHHDNLRINADKVQIQQVLINLMKNAIEAMHLSPESQRRLLVRTAQENTNPRQPQVTISISDSGIGIAPDNHDVVFDSFFTTKDDGLGLGLSLSRTIVEDHGGRLWFEPNHDQGVTFHLTIPVAKETDEADI